MAKRTWLNIKARKIIAAIAEEKQLDRCELQFPGCMGEAHGPAHRHKRVWYYDKPDHYLSDFNQWLAVCQHCHHILEYETTQAEINNLFRRLRP